MNKVTPKAGQVWEWNVKVYCDRCGYRHRDSNITDRVEKEGIGYIRCTKCCNWGARFNPVTINGMKQKGIYQ